MSTDLETTDFSYLGEFEFDCDCDFNGEATEAPTEAPTEEPIPIPSDAYQGGEEVLGEAPGCEVVCDEYNTPNTEYDPVNDCNWVTNAVTGE